MAARKGTETPEVSSTGIVPMNRSTDSSMVSDDAAEFADTSSSTADGGVVDTPTQFATQFRRLRACARCHRLKMRCVFQDPSFKSCLRCYRSGVKCSMTEDPTENARPRRPRKAKLPRTSPLGGFQHSMVQVTKYLTDIQKNMNDQEQAGSIVQNVPPDLDSLGQIQFQLSSLQMLLAHVSMLSNGVVSSASSANSMKQGPVKSVPSLPYIPYEQNVMKELFKLGILEKENAKSKFAQFLEEELDYWPCVSLPPYYTFDWLLDNEPLSLLAFIAVTCLDEPDLHDTLLYYLEGSLSKKTSLTGEITVPLILIYLVLSLWCSPPRKWGSYKHQMSLMMALNITLCLDLGNEQYRNNPEVLKDGSKERMILRAYMGVYSCCGSLGLSLPRFKVVSWTPAHERCAQLLLMGDSTPHDRFLYYYSKLVALGEEIFQFLYPNTFAPPDLDPSRMPHDSLRMLMVGYERRMQQMAAESGLFTEDSKARNMLSIIYYQLLMTMYDYVVCKVLLRKDQISQVYMQTLTRLVKAAEKVISSFIMLCDQTSNFPTFFYYRPMHALVALIRARLLVKTQDLDLDIDVEGEFNDVSEALSKLSKRSGVASRMYIILTRISKWMKASSKFNKDGATNSMVDLLNELGKERAVENIRVNVRRPSDYAGGPGNRYNRFINYDQDTLAKHGGHKRSFGNISGSGSSSPATQLVPSPIGFSNSDFPEITFGPPAKHQKSEAPLNQESPLLLLGTPSFSAAVPNAATSQVVDASHSAGQHQGIADTSPSSSGVQQTNFLNDIFTQLDDDLMSFQLTNGLDFLPEGVDESAFSAQGNADAVGGNDYPFL